MTHLLTSLKLLLLSSLSSWSLSQAVQLDMIANIIENTDPAVKPLMVEVVELPFLTANNPVQMRPDLSYSDVVVGVNPPNDWGISCSETATDDQCKFLGENIKKVYTRSLFDVRPIRFTCPVLHENSGFVAPENTEIIGYGLVDPSESSKDNSPFRDTGFLGLAPNSTFLEHLINRYSMKSKSITFLIEYNYTDHENRWQINNKTFGNGSLKLNCSEADLPAGLSKVGTFSTVKSTGHWEIDGVKMFIGDEQYPLETDRLCITNTRNHLLALNRTTFFKSKIYSKMCEQNTTCNLKVDLNAAPRIKLEIQGQSIYLEPEDYLYKDTNQNVYADLSTSINSWISEKACSSMTRLGLGKLFFEKHAMLFNVSIGEGAGSSVSIYRHSGKKSRTLSSGEKKILLIISVILSFIVLIAMIAKQTLIGKELNSYKISGDGINEQASLNLTTDDSAIEKTT